MTNLPVLYLPNGEVVEKAHTPEGKSSRLNFNIVPISTMDLKGAQPKRDWMQWKLLYDMYRRHPTVRAAIDKIVKVATNTGYDFVPRDSRAKVKQSEYRKCKQFFDKQHDFVGELRRIYQDLLIFGDAYLYVVPDRRRQPAKLKRLAPWTIHIKSKRNGELDYYVQRDPDDPLAESVIFRAHEILHFRIPDPADDLYGLSLLESIKLTVTTDLNAMTWNKSYFQNGAATGTMLLIEEASEAEVDRAREYIKRVYSGSENAHLPMILTGKMRVEKSVVSHEEMGFLGGRKHLMQEILSVLDVPPAKIGVMESANRSNSKEQDKTFRTESVTPLQYIVESVINDQFLRGVLGVQETTFRHSKADVRDAQEQMDLWSDGLQHGIYNINEVRAELGRAPIEGGDINTVMTPTGAVPVVDMELYFRLPRLNIEEIPQDVHAGHGHPDGTQDETMAGPEQKPTTNVEVGAPLATKSMARQLWLQSQELLEVNEDDERLIKIERDLSKAVKTTDNDMRLALIERAYAAMVLYHNEQRQEVTDDE